MMLRPKKNSVLFIKGFFRTIILSLCFFLTFSSFKYMPGGLLAQDLYTGIMIIFLVLIYPLLVINKNSSVNQLEIYGILLIVVESNFAALMSSLEFGQPYLYGLLNQRGLALIGSSFLFTYLYRKQVFSFNDVQQAFVWTIWILLLVNTLIYNFTDPQDLLDYAEESGLHQAGTEEGAALRLDNQLLTFGFFYYVLIGVEAKENRDLRIYCSLPFLGYLLFITGGVANLLAIVFSYAYFFIRWISWESKIIYFFKFGVILFIFGSVLYFAPIESMVSFKEEFIVNLQDEVSEAFKVAFTGKEGNDPSANARIDEVALAIPYIQKHPLLGNGFLSNKWEGGFSGKLGYFHPSDIGLWGIVYEYGVLGLLLFSVQIYFFWIYARQISVRQGQFHRFSNGIKGYMLYFLINSITTGRFVFTVEQSFFVITLLYCMATFVNQKPRVIARGEFVS